MQVPRLEDFNDVGGKDLPQATKRLNLCVIEYLGIHLINFLSQQPVQMYEVPNVEYYGDNENEKPKVFPQVDTR